MLRYREGWETMKKPELEKTEIIMALLIVMALILSIATGVRLFSGKRAAKMAAEAAAASATPTLVVSTPTPMPAEQEQTISAEERDGPKANSGGFMTQTGTSLNLVVNWYAEEAGEDVVIYMDFLVDCFSLHTGSRKEGLTVGVGSNTFVFDSAPVDVSGGPSTVTLYSACVTVPASDFTETGCPAYATWHFGGSYGGQPVPELTALGNITLF